MAEGTALLEREATTSSFEKEVLVVEEMKSRLAELSRQRGHAAAHGDVDKYKSLEEEYNKLSSARSLEQTLASHVKTEMSEKAKKNERDGRTDPKGKLLNLTKKELKDAGGNIIGIIFQIDREWESIGWNNQKIELVRSSIKNMLNIPLGDLGDFEIDFSPEKQKALLELLVASGFTAEQILEKLDPDQLRAKIEQKRAERQVGAEYGFVDYFHSLGIREDYIKRYVFPELFQNPNEDREYLEDPDSVEKLAWQMGAKGENKELWGIHGKFPLLEMRIMLDEKDKTKVDAKKSQYHLNKGNFRRWIRERMSNLYDLSPESAPIYFEAVLFNKGPFYKIPLQDFFYRKNEFLASENDWLDYTDVLERDMQLDPWMMLYARKAWFTMNPDQGSDKIAEVLKGIHNMSDATKKVYGGNMMRFLTTIPLNDSGERDSDGFTKRDNTIGAAWTEMILIYQHISDFDKLEEILGKDSDLFKEEYMLDAMKKFALKLGKNTGKEDAFGFLGKEYAENFKKAYTNGRVVTKANKESFTKLLNIFSAHAEDSNKTKFIREHLLPDFIDKKYHFVTDKVDENGKAVEDPYSKWMTWLLAYSWTNWTGISAYNDTTAQSFNMLTKWLRSAQYRLKMADNRAGGIGNPRTIFQFKQLYVPFMDAVKTTARTEVRDRDGKIIGTREKAMNEVLHELQVLRTKQLQFLDYLEHVKKVSPDELADERRKLDKVYRTRAGELEFRDNAQRTHQVDHIDRVSGLWDIMINAKEIDFHKFTSYDPYTPGVAQFDREAFQKEIQDGILKKLRYAIEVYGDINYNMEIRAPKLVPDHSREGLFKFKTVWQTMPLAQAMFGHELLDREEFWVRGKNGIPLRDKNKHRIIDYNKVQANKTLIWKQWAIMKFAADIQQHRMKYSMDKKFHPTYYDHIFEALESVPGAVWGDEYQMSKTVTPENFFNHHDMAILKRKALAGPWLGIISGLPIIGDLTEKFARTRFYMQWLWRDLRAKEDEEGMGIGLLLGSIFGQIFKERT